MVDSTKTRRSVVGISNLYEAMRTNGQLYHSESTDTYNVLDEATSVWSRPMPPRLTPTELWAEHQWWSSESGFIRGGPASLFLWETKQGSAQFLNLHRPPPNGFTAQQRTVTSSEAEDRARLAETKASAKFVGDRASFGESLGEFRETANMIANRLRYVAKIASLVRRRHFTQLSAMLKADVADLVSNSKSASNAFLELEFGWRPALSDAYSALQYRSQKLQAGDVRRKRSGDLAPADASRFGATNQFGGKAGASGVVSNPRAANLVTYGLIDPAIPWKLVRWSFLVDWAAPIASILSAMAGHIGLTNVVTWRLAVSGSEWSYIGSPFNWCFNRNTYVHRSVGTDLADVFRPPPFFNLAVRGSVEKVALSAALLRQQLGSTGSMKRWRSIKPK